MHQDLEYHGHVDIGPKDLIKGKEDEFEDRHKMFIMRLKEIRKRSFSGFKDFNETQIIHKKAIVKEDGVPENDDHQDQDHDLPVLF